MLLPRMDSLQFLAMGMIPKLMLNEKSQMVKVMSLRARNIQCSLENGTHFGFFIYLFISLFYFSILIFLA